MFAIFALLGVGLAMTAMVGTGSEEAEPEDQSSPEPERNSDASGGPPQFVLGDDDDFVVAESDAVGMQLLADAIGAAQNASPEEVADFKANISLVGEPMNLSTGGGSDVVLGSAADDRIDTGTGDDDVLGGAGDDVVHLGEGSDGYGLGPGGFQSDLDSLDGQVLSPTLDAFVTQLEQSDAGNDSVYGGKGDDAVQDGRGANRLAGNEGNDTLSAVDVAGEVTPDMVVGGWGEDVLMVDQGDTVWGGNGADWVEVNMPDRLEDGFQVVKMADYQPGVDRIELDGVTEALSHLAPEELPETICTVEDLPDGSGAIIKVNGIPVVQVVGGQGLQVSDIVIS